MMGHVGDFFVIARPAGIGLVRAAIGAAEEIAQTQPRFVVLLGTCGAYRSLFTRGAHSGGGERGRSAPTPPQPNPVSASRPDHTAAKPPTSGLAIGDVVIADRVMLVDPSVVMGASEFPEAVSTMLRADGGICEGLATTGARRVTVATTLAVTVDDAVATQIARATGAHVEHMETLAVATACAVRGVVFSAVLGVANIVGAQAREQWRANHRRASEAAARHLLRWLELGACGAPPRL
jgi:nucleoside phosphorylase